MSDSFYNAGLKLSPGVTSITTPGDFVVLNPSNQYLIGNNGNPTDYSITFPAINVPNSWSLGTQIIVENKDLVNITVKNSSGGTIAVVGSGIVQYFYLTDNSTVDGSWTSRNYSGNSPVVSTFNMTFGQGTYILTDVKTLPVTCERFDGNTVSITIPQLRGFVGASNSFNTSAMPVAFTPSATRSGIYSFFDGTIHTIGRYQVNTSGIINFFANTDALVYPIGTVNIGPNGQALLFNL